MILSLLSCKNTKTICCIFIKGLANMCQTHVKNSKIEIFFLKKQIMQLICEKFKNVIRYTHYNKIFLFLNH
jgi:tartrate dehydratase beta subunit/fumarate hydratase class I family protein